MTALSLADAARHRPELIDELIAGIGIKAARVKFEASKALELLSASCPQLLYPHFDFFAAMLGNKNSILKWNAMQTLANLARVDSEGKLDLILDAYLAPITGPAMITAAHAMRGAAMIGAAKPHLAARIAHRILRVERAAYATPECGNIAIGHALRALALLPETEATRSFARRQLANSRGATAAKAQKLLRQPKPAAASAG